MKIKTNRNKKGFTLIELLVVIAIIAILAAILFPVFARAREKARQTTCSSNQRQIAVSLQMYAQDHESRFPSYDSVWKAAAIDPAILKCPTAGSSVTNAYGFNISMSGIALSSIETPSDALLTADSSAADNILKSTSDLAVRHSGQLISSYVDGHVAANTGTTQFLYPTMDLFAGFGRSTMIEDGKLGWTRNPTVDDFNYPSKFADLTTGDGYPPPCLQLTGTTITRTIIPVNNSSTINSWVLTGYAKVPSMTSNNACQLVTVYDNNATPKSIVQLTYYRAINTPDEFHATLSARFNNTIADSTVSDNHYENSWPTYNKWIPFSMTATANGIYCSIGIAPSIKVAPGAGSDWKNPAKVSVQSLEPAFWDNLKFGDY